VQCTFDIEKSVSNVLNVGWYWLYIENFASQI